MSMTSASSGRTKKIIYTSLLSALFLFLIITAYISFSNYFKGNTEGFVMCPNFAVTNSDFGSVIVLRKTSDGNPIQDALVTAEIQDSLGGSLCKESSKTNLSGSVSFNLKVPDKALGPLTLLYKSNTPYGKFSFKKDIELKENLNIRIIAEKQEYLPGESIPFKILLSQNSLPFKGELNVKLLDTEDNQLFFSSGKTSEFGVFSGEIPLGDNLNEGLYKIVVESSISKATRTLKVSQPSPSSLELTAFTSRKYFSPAVKNTIKFFVEDNLGARVAKTQITASVYEIIDGDKNPGKHFSGFTDSQGVFSFDYTPEEYSKNFLSDKSSEILIEAKAKKSGNIETDFFGTFYFSDKPFYIHLFPECKELVPRVNNRIFILASDPQGRGIQSDVSITLKDKELNLKTDAQGFAFFELDPSLESGFVPLLKAKDAYGNSAEAILDIPSMLSLNTFSASVDKVFLLAGEDITVKLRTLEEEGTYYLFLQDEEQILLNREIKLKNKIASDTFKIPSSASGVCSLSVAKINTIGELEKTSVPIYVFPNVPVSFAMNTDRRVYHPDEHGKVLFNLFSKNSRVSSIIAGLAQIPSQPSASLPQMALSVMVSDMGEFSFPLSDDIQNKARVALSALESLNKVDEGIYFENVYKSSLKQGYERKIGYYQSLFSYSLKIVLIICIFSFFALCILVIFRFVAVSSSNVHPLKIEFSDDLAPLILFNIAIPFIMLLSSVCTVFLLVLRKISLSSLLFSENAVWPSLTALLLLFGFALTLKRISDTFRAVKISSSLLWSQNLILTYTVSLIVIILMLMFSSVTSLPFLNLSVILKDNLPLCLIVALSFFVIPFVIVALSLVYFSSKPSKILYKSIFYLFIILFSGLFIFSFISVSNGDFPLQDRLTEKLNLQKISKEDNVPYLIDEEAGELVEAFFPDGKTFIFNSSVITDKSGQAEINFIVPKVSGEVTAKAIALTSDGESFPITTDFIVERPLELSFPLPKYAYINDEIIVPLQVHNNSDSSLNINMKIIAGEGLTVNGLKNEKISLPKGKTFSKDILIKAIGGVGDARVVISLSTDGFKENVTKEINLKSSEIENNFIYSGLISNVKSSFDISNEALSGNATISAETGYLAVLLNRNSYIKKYASPSSYYSIYSMKIKSAILKQMRALKQNTSPSYIQIEKELVMEYQNLLVYRNQEGLFSLFKDSNTDLFLSSVALEALVSASEIISIDAHAIEKTALAIINMQKQNGSWNDNLAISARAVNALNMAGYSKEESIKKAFDYLEKYYLTDNDPYTLALIAKIFYGRNKNIFDKSVALLNKNLLHTEGTCHWETKYGLWAGAEGIESHVEITAIALSSLLRHKDYNEPCKEAMNYLMRNRDKYGGWHSLAGTYEVLDMLAIVFENNKSEHASAKLSVNGERFDIPIVTDSGVATTIKLPKGLLKKENEISWNLPEGYFCTYMLSLPFYSDSVKKDTSLKGLSLSSSYSKSSLKEGETVLNYVAVSNKTEKELHHFIVEIPIPSGFSFVSHSLFNDENLQAFELDSDKLKLYFKFIPKNASKNFSVRFICLQKGYLRLENTSVYKMFNPFIKVYSGKKDFIIKK